MEMLLDILLQQDNFLTAEQLANMIGVTERSIRNYVNKLNQTSDEGYLIESSNRGYKLTNKVIGKEFNNPIDLGNQSNLMFNIVAILLQQKSYISCDFLAQKLHYSMENIRSKVQELFVIIKKLNVEVQLQTKIFTGILLIGRESQKRLLLEQLVDLTSIKRQSVSNDISEYMTLILNEQDAKYQMSVVDQTFSKRHIKMIFAVYLKVIIHMAILSWRVNNHQFLDNENSSMTKNELYTEYDIAKELITYENIQDKLFQESINLGNYLIALPLNISDDKLIIQDNHVEVQISKILQRTENYYQIPIFSNKNYRSRVIKHILRLLLPLNDHIPIFNPLLENTKREYLFAYSISCFLYAELQKIFQIDVSDSAISYLTIHIQLILQEENHEKIRTQLVFPGKNIQGELLRYKISTYFTNIEISSISSQYEKKTGDRLVIIIGSQGPIQPNTIHISERLNGEDIHKIQHFIDGMGTQTLLKSASFYRISVEKPTRAIEELTKRAGFSSFVPYINEREQMSTTDIGNYVALPHPFLKGSPTQAKLIIGINDHLMQWGNQKVQLILLFIPDDNLTTNEHFFEETYKHVKDFRTIQKLIQSVSKEEFIQTWNSGGSY